MFILVLLWLVVLALAIAVTTMMIVANKVQPDPDLPGLTLRTCPTLVRGQWKLSTNICSKCTTAMFVVRGQLRHLEACLHLTSLARRLTTSHWT